MAVLGLGSMLLGLPDICLIFFPKKSCFFLGETLQSLSFIDASAETEPSR